LFDSTGIALQNSATVPLEYERAVAAGVGIEKKMISNVVYRLLLANAFILHRSQ